MNKNSQNSGLGLRLTGWKYYNSIKKKAMEQEFSWSGLLVSLSIAFFVVISAATGLNVAYKTIEQNKESGFSETKVYWLENLSDDRTERNGFC